LTLLARSPSPLSLFLRADLLSRQPRGPMPIDGLPLAAREPAAPHRSDLLAHLIGESVRRATVESASRTIDLLCARRPEDGLSPQQRAQIRSGGAL